MKTKKNSNPQGKVWARRGQYENALTKSDVTNRPLELSYADMEMGEIDGVTVTKRVYFKSIQASLGLKLRDPNVPLEDKLILMFDLLGSSIVDPATAEPIMTAEEWGNEDLEFINKVSGAVLGIQFIADQTESETEQENDNPNGLTPTELDDEAQAANPFAETDG